MKVLGVQTLVALVFMGLLSGTAAAAGRDSIRANSQTQFQSEHQARFSALYQENTN